jgi:2-oxoglutarate ferredoxin oxidoreductase subunit delta
MRLKQIVKRCKGCGICVAFCPKQILKINEIEKMEIIDESQCIGCKQCELRCPDYAIFVEK